MRQRLPYIEIGDLAISDLVSTTFDICKKLAVRNEEFDGLEIAATKNILERFMLLKVKEGGNVGKELEKYWVFLLQEHLAIYDKKN